MIARDTIERCTLWRGPATTDAPREVVIAPPDVTIEQALERLRPSLARPAAPLRLIAQGATVTRRHPSWLAAIARPLALTELDAYLSREKGAALKTLAAPVERWLDRVFDGLVPDTPASSVLWSTLAQRSFDEAGDAWMLAAALAARHGADELRCLDERWLGWTIIEARRQRAPRRSIADRTRRVWLPLLTAAVGGAAVVRRVRSFAAEAPARRWLAARRGHRWPDVVLGASGDDPRGSRPTLDTVPRAVVDGGRDFGVLLLHTLAGPQPFPSLVSLDPQPAWVEQAVSVEGWGALARVMIDSLARGVRASVRAATAPRLTDGAVDVELPIAPLKLAKLCAVDVLRVREAVAATEALLARSTPPPGTPILYPHATQASDSVGVMLLGRAGARTIEIVHGIVDVQWQVGCGRTSTAEKLFWTESEATQVQNIAPTQRCRGAFFPRGSATPRSRTQLPDGAPLPILVISNYLPSQWGVSTRRFEPNQEPLFHALEACLDAGLPITLRWRPHPADDPAIVDEELRRHPSLTRSPNRDLAADLAWARIVVSSYSTVVLEALLAELPVFVHDVPRWDKSCYAAFSDERRFTDSASLVAGLRALVPLVAKGDPRALDPERAARRRLFGPTGTPRLVADAVVAELLARGDAPPLDGVRLSLLRP